MSEMKMIIPDNNEKIIKEKSIKEKKELQDRIRGCLIGGAAGDALGYAIEFDQENSIFATYGKDGITAYQLAPKSGTANISDDTQMTLFTANGLLVGSTRMALRGISAAPHHYVAAAYQDWLLTQEHTMQELKHHESFNENVGHSWLLEVPELFHRRAPGNTCLSALRHSKKVEDYLNNPVNNSKGCGGIMRVAPMALLYEGSEYDQIKDIDLEGAYIAAITHGHPLGYMPAAVITHIIHRLVYGPKNSLKIIVLEAKETCEEIFAGYDYVNEMTHIIELAIELSENDDSDLNNIHKLGEGWVAEETLGIALYCALKYQDDFSKALIVSVNHNGDSDSTGAVTGNILGALVGYEGIENKWKKTLELQDVILEIADDLCHGYEMMEVGQEGENKAWIEKYVSGRKE